MKLYKKLFFWRKERSALQSPGEGVRGLFSVHEPPESPHGSGEESSVNFGVFSYDKVTEVITLNSSMCKLFRLADPWKGRTVQQFIANSQVLNPAEFKESLRRALSLRRGGLNTEIVLEGRSIRVFGKVTGDSTVNGCCFETTELKQADENRQKIHRLEMLNEEHAQRRKQMHMMLRTISHEMRNPMQGIISNLEFINSKTDVLEVKESVNHTLKAVFHQLDTLNEMIAFQSYEIQQSELGALTDVTSLIESVLIMFKQTCRTKGLFLNLKVISRVSCVLQEKNVMRILMNLVTNAVKFTESGGITVSVEQKPPDRLEISVSDTGIGIPISMQRDIFFKQGVVQHEGILNSGLGLNICATVVEMISGEISFESAPGVGTNVRFSFPVKSLTSAAVDDKNEAQEQSDSLSEGTKSLSVLFCEDNSVIRRAFQLLLSTQHTCTVVEDGADAIRRLNGEDFDVVISDQIMPLSSGLDVLRALRAKTTRVPFVLLTGDNDPELSRQAHLIDGGTGLMFILLKPVRKNELLSLMKRIQQVLTDSVLKG